MSHNTRALLASIDAKTLRAVADLLDTINETPLTEDPIVTEVLFEDVRGRVLPYRIAADDDGELMLCMYDRAGD